MSPSLLKLCFQEVKISFFPSFDLESCKKNVFTHQYCASATAYNKPTNFQFAYCSMYRIIHTRVHGRKWISKLLSHKKVLHDKFISMVTHLTWKAPYNVSQCLECFVTCSYKGRLRFVSFESIYLILNNFNWLLWMLSLITH